MSDDKDLFIATRKIPESTRRVTIEGVHRSKIKWVKIDEVPTNNGKIDYSKIMNRAV